MNNIFLHIKSGNFYRFITEALREEDQIPLIVYQSIGDGKIWVRPKSEFYSRFHSICSHIDIIAIRNKDYNEWLLTPINYWLENFHIPDSHLNLKIKGMEEVADHTYIPLSDNGDGAARLIEAGVLIVNNPEWYYQKPNYKEPEE